jgi:hypothetical protein
MPRVSVEEGATVAAECAEERLGRHGAKRRRVQSQLALRATTPKHTTKTQEPSTKRSCVPLLR